MKFQIFLLLIIGLSSCSSNPKKDTVEGPIKAKIELFGHTQGTTYSIICNDSINISVQEIDSVLREFDLELSTYEDSSFISKFNSLSSGVISYSSKNRYFEECLYQSYSIFLSSNGLFDPSILPLVDAWSFFKKDHISIPDSNQVDSLRSLISFKNGKHFTFNDNGLENLSKISPGFRLDFNAIAQGYAVDVLADYVTSKGAENFYIEIGGEVRVKGQKNDGTNWILGIDKPEENSSERDIISKIEVKDCAIATSGNYRKFYEKNGVKYSHTISPITGYPVQHSMLSATVVTDNCAKADAYATAFMVMGVEESMTFVKENPNLNLAVYFIFQNAKGRMEVAFNKSFDNLIIKN